jgi:hypothetical protein
LSTAICTTSSSTLSSTTTTTTATATATATLSAARADYITNSLQRSRNNSNDLIFFFFVSGNDNRPTIRLAAAVVALLLLAAAAVGGFRCEYRGAAIAGGRTDHGATAARRAIDGQGILLQSLCKSHSKVVGGGATAQKEACYSHHSAVTGLAQCSSPVHTAPGCDGLVR